MWCTEKSEKEGIFGGSDKIQYWMEVNQLSSNSDSAIEACEVAELNIRQIVSIEFRFAIKLPVMVQLKANILHLQIILQAKIFLESSESK